MFLKSTSRDQLLQKAYYSLSGTSEGGIMVFDIPPRGTAVKLQETLNSHKAAICELEARGGQMVSTDEEGNIILWQSGGHFTEIIKIDGKGLVAILLE